MTEISKYVQASKDMSATHFRAASAIESHCEFLNSSEPQNAPEHSAMYISSAMLRAFSIELSLKSLISLDSTQIPREHDLHKLFQKLGPETQNNLTSIFNSRLTRNFSEIINEIKDTFVFWRYLPEKLESGIQAQFDTKELKIIAETLLEFLDAKINI